MPISQATILAIYGDLCDLVEKVETLHNQMTQPDLFTKRSDRNAAMHKGLQAIFEAAKASQRDAINHMMADDPEIEVNPLTGRLDE